MEIVLLRHGKPDFEFTGKVKASELAQLVKSYNLSGISSIPPLPAMEKAQNCRAVVCSDLPRSMQSANALGIAEIHLSDSVFREAGLPYASWGRLKLSLDIWAILFRILWFIGYSENGESISNAKKRAKIGASQLIQLAREHETVLLVGHGFINRFIAKELLLNGWIGPINPGKQFWEFGVYNYTITTQPNASQS